MRFLLSASLIFLLYMTSVGQKLFKTNEGHVSFYSHTPIEDIRASSTKGSSALNTATNQIAFMVLNTSFQFANSLMQEHFNEKYMESEKFPKSSFSGKINETIDWNANGEHKVTATGKLNIHGVEQTRTLPATILVQDGKIHVTSDFNVKTADHKIEIPKLVWEKIAEEIKVTLNADYILQ